MPGKIMSECQLPVLGQAEKVIMGAPCHLLGGWQRPPPPLQPLWLRASWLLMPLPLPRPAHAGTASTRAARPADACKHARIVCDILISSLYMGPYRNNPARLCRIVMNRAWYADGPHSAMGVAFSCLPMPTRPTTRALPPNRAKADLPCAARAWACVRNSFPCISACPCPPGPPNRANADLPCAARARHA